jgi:hypothetical protein
VDTPDLSSQIAAYKANQANVAAMAAPVLNAPSMAPTAAPNMGAPSMPSVSMIPAPPTQMQKDESRLNMLKSSGSGVDQILHPVDANGNPTGQPVGFGRKLLGGMARAGDIALSVFGDVSPFGGAIDRELPGTTAHHNHLVAQQQGLIAQDQAQAQSDQQRADNQSLLELHQKEADKYGAQADDLTPLTLTQDQAADINQPNLAGTTTTMRDYRSMLTSAGNNNASTTNAGLRTNSTLAQHGLKYGPDGKTIVDDTNSEAFQSHKVLDDVRQSKQELQDAQTAYTNAKSDPNSPLFQQMAQRLATAQQNAGAAQTRAQAYMGNYLKGAFNTDLHGNVLPGAPQISDSDGNVTTPGSTNASAATKANASVAKMNDVHGALDSMEAAAKGLAQSGGSLNSPGVIYAMQHVNGTPSQFAQSLDKANLSPQERAYVLAIQAGHENIQALRGSLGSGVTDSQIDRLDSMIPSGSTPDLNYFLGQTGQIRATANRLSTGLTTAHGGLAVHSGGTTPPSGAPGSQSLTDGGVTYNIPAAQVAAFKRDHPNAR